MSDKLFPNFTKEDAVYMNMALQLAERGRGSVSPNPLVGALVVKSGQILGKGYHARYGGPHAEAIALADAKGKTDGATLYVTLEPCVHYGRTPPCVNQIEKSRIKRVVIACKDPDKLVDGKGIEHLIRAHIQVDVGLLENKARAMNKAYFKHRENGLPYVILKLAATLDAKLASASGASRWITGKQAREYGHKLRAQSDAIMVGVHTVLADNPRLTVRLTKGRNPLKVILDSQLRTPVNAKLFDEGKTLIFTTRASLLQRNKYNPVHVSFTAVDLDGKDKLNLTQVLAELGRRQVTQLLVEGGGRLASELLRQDLVDHFVYCMSPSFLGKGIGYTETMEYDDINQRLRLKDINISWLGQDLKIEGTPYSLEEEEGIPQNKEESA